MDSASNQLNTIRPLLTAAGLIFTLGIGSNALAEGNETPDVAAAPRAMAGDLFPPNAKAGECYARLFVPPTYSTNTEQVLKREASSRIEIVPAQYEFVQERVLVKEASSKLVEVPAAYENVSETIVVEPARTLWRLGKTSKSRTADRSLVEEARKLGAPIDNASGGDCFAEYLKAEAFETTTEQVVKREASTRVETIPARYDWVEEQVMTQEASTRLVEVPAVYETRSEQILVRPARTEWKRGRGPIQRVDGATGEIMCLVEIPAEYKTVSKRVLVSAATTRSVPVPAEYKTVKVRKLVAGPSEKVLEIPAEYQTVSKRQKVSDASRSWRAAGVDGPGDATGRRLCLSEIPEQTRTVTRRVVKTPARTNKTEIPAEYKTVKVRKLVAAASERKIEIPAEYQTVTRRNMVADGHLEWTSILCETNATPSLISDVQRALKKAGHDPGPVDGQLGGQTLTAVRAFQRAKGLPSGNITTKTLDALGVRH